MIIYKAKIHWVSYIPSIIMIIIGTPSILILISHLLVMTDYSLRYILMLLFVNIFWILFLFLAIVGIIKFIRLKKTQILLTENNFSIETGILSKSVIDVPISRIEFINISQSALGRFFDYGKVTIHFSYKNIATYTISKPNKLRELLIEK